MEFIRLPQNFEPISKECRSRFQLRVVLAQFFIIGYHSKVEAYFRSISIARKATGNLAERTCRMSSPPGRQAHQLHF